MMYQLFICPENNLEFLQNLTYNVIVWKKVATGLSFHREINLIVKP